MQQIVYDYIEKIINHDIIDNCLNHDKNILNESNSFHSNSSTPSQSIKKFTNNNNKDSLKDTKYENKKILFSFEVIENINNKEKNDIKNNNNTFINKFLVKKRKRIFKIQKIRKEKKDSIKKIIRKSDILKKIITSSKKIKKKIVNNNKKNYNNNSIVNYNNNNTNTNININQENNNFNDNKDINSKKRKKEKILNEKELQIMYEQKFLENINKEYSDKEYEIDMNECLKDKKLKFMKDNFPIMFQKDKYYLYSILPKKKQATKKYFIFPNYFNDIINKNLYNNYDILYTDYDLNFKDNNNIIYENNNINIEYQNEYKSKSNIVNQKFLNEGNLNIFKNNENMINDNIGINCINSIPNILDVNEEVNNKKNLLNENNIKFINNCNNKIKIFRILKIKKKYKNKNNIIPKNNKKKINNENSIINNNSIDLIIKEKFSLLPKKVWSLEKNEIDIDNFFDNCVQIWPFDKCCFIKEIALEYLMKNNYNINICLEKLNDFIYFMKKRAEELDFPVISNKIKTIKKYNLRKTNFN